MDLKNKKVLIAGACGGIGSKIVERFRDSELILIDRDISKLESLIHEHKLSEVKYYKLDMSDTQEILDIVSKVSAENPEIDVLINATGIGVYKPIEDVELAEWQSSLDINLTGPYFLTKQLLNSLKASKESYVVNLGSGMGTIAVGGRSVYCVTKFGLRGMTLSLAEEFRGTNVHFIHMVLGSVLTGFGPMTLEEKKQKSLEGKSYLTPESVAEKIYNVISESTTESEIEFMPSGYENPINR